MKRPNKPATTQLTCRLLRNYLRIMSGQNLPMRIYFSRMPCRSRKPLGPRWSRGLSATVGSAATVVTMMFISIPQGLAASSCHVIVRYHLA